MINVDIDRLDDQNKLDIFIQNKMSELIIQIIDETMMEPSIPKNTTFKIVTVDDSMLKNTKNDLKTTTIHALNTWSRRSAVFFDYADAPLNDIYRCSASNIIIDHEHDDIKNINIYTVYIDLKFLYDYILECDNTINNSLLDMINRVDTTFKYDQFSHGRILLSELVYGGALCHLSTQARLHYMNIRYLYIWNMLYTHGYCFTFIKYTNTILNGIEVYVYKNRLYKIMHSIWLKLDAIGENRVVMVHKFRTLSMKNFR